MMKAKKKKNESDNSTDFVFRAYTYPPPRRCGNRLGGEIYRKMGGGVNPGEKGVNCA